MPAPDTDGADVYSITSITVSANGRNIAFLTGWRDPSDPASLLQDVFVSDATARTTSSLGVELVSADVDHQVQQPAISGDGTKVAFTTSASLTSRDTNTHFDIYVHDVATGANALASRTVAGGTGNKQSIAPWISRDGRYVAFSSRSNNLAAGVTDTSVTQAYLVDLQTNRTTLMSKTAAGVAGNAFAQALGVSANGRYVVFESAATDFGFPANPNGFVTWQIYRYDRVNDTIGLVSHAGGKAFPSNQGSGALDAVISADGAHIAYSSTSRDLDKTPGITDAYGTLDLFAWSQ
jgi:dipeptidyl aminopeptidase/acylaminoacyl peptidase